MQRMTHRLESQTHAQGQAAEFSKPVARRGLALHAIVRKCLCLFLHVSLLTCMQIIAKVAVAYHIHVVDLRCVDTILSYTDLQVDTVQSLNLW